MADRPAGFLGRLRHFPPADLAGETDAALLDRFAAARDDAPFAELVRRHGPMVLGVCRRVLGQTADADDAFQAAFLVLARKAGAVRGRPVGGWLCRVAGNVARRQRDLTRRRTRHEHTAATARATAFTPTPADDVYAILDDELDRLPDGERMAVVACLLEGRSQEAAARELGWSFGTLRRRLDRGKELLRGRLARRGVTAPAGFAGVVFVHQVPPALADLTRVGAVGFARGVKTAAPAVALAEGALMTTLRTKFAVMTGLVVAAGLTVGTGWALQPQPGGGGAGGPGRGAGGVPGVPGGGAGQPGGNPFGGAGGAAGQPAADGRIRPGDRLHITAKNVFETDPINGVYVVEPSGKVPLGPAYGGRVGVAGKSFEEAEVVIRTHVRQFAKSAEVQVKAADPARADTLEDRVRRLEEEVARLKAAAGGGGTGAAGGIPGGPGGGPVRP